MTESAPQPQPASTPPRRSRRRWAYAAVIALLAAAVAWQWLDGRSRIGDLREEVAQRVRAAETESRDARLVARQTQEALRESQAKLAQLELKVAESQNQQVALEALYQELSRSRDEWVLAEVEQILTIASQQLQLAGNVQAALVALQTAEARLARSDRPQFTPLRKVLGRDIERLKASPNVDLAGLAVKLDQVTASIDSLPLARDARPPAQQPVEAPPAGKDGAWARLGAELLGEFRQLVRVQNVERPDPVLLSPSQNFFLRENVKLRLLNARLALLARDEATFRSDVRAANAWLDRYFDRRARATASAQAVLGQLSASAINIALPTIGESITAVRSYKVAQERRGR